MSERTSRGRTLKELFLDEKFSEGTPELLLMELQEVPLTELVLKEFLREHSLEESIITLLLDEFIEELLLAESLKQLLLEQSPKKLLL